MNEYDQDCTLMPMGLVPPDTEWEWSEFLLEWGDDTDSNGLCIDRDEEFTLP